MKQTLTKKKKKSKLKNQQTFNVVPVCEHNIIEVDGLYESLENVIERYVQRQGATVAEIVGSFKA